MNGKKEFGDYQTPAKFAIDICQYLKMTKKLAPSIIIEPTCGIGNFLNASRMFDAEEIIGIEINPEYCHHCAESIIDSRLRIFNEDFFTFDFSSIIKGKKEILVIGNPPWVTNSYLSGIDSNNLPEKQNFKGLKGMDAITGASNFDICEYIILQLVYSLVNTNTTIAMLCKTSVARSVFEDLNKNHINFKSCEIYEFDAKQIFKINASACLLVIQLSDSEAKSDYCNVYSFDNPKLIKNTFGFIDGKLYSNIKSESCDFSGVSCFEWRQGVKHDCSKVMELTVKDDYLLNGLREAVHIESKYLFPLVKSSMFKKPIINTYSKYVIVTQKKIKEDTTHIASDAPKTWDYLTSHRNFFSNRKSSIYKDAPEFSMFGVGDYSYAKYKVGISGFYKKPLFSILLPENDTPAMTDDTSYFICFPTYDLAYTAMLLLNCDKVQNFLLTIAFLDAKRPFTKKVLSRIDFKKILNAVTFQELKYTESNLRLDNYLNQEMLNSFKDLPEFSQNEIHF